MSQGTLPGLDTPASDSAELAHAPSKRRRTLTAQHDHLLAQIARKRADHARLASELQRAADALHAQVAPLKAEVSQLNDEVHGMFAALLKDPARRAPARRDIKNIYDDLCESGILLPLEPSDEDMDAFD